MKTTTTLALSAIAGLLLTAGQASAHCQVPCGIYNDPNVIAAMHTDWTTIDKAAKQITELSKDPAANAHQLTRWVNNKESHAQNIQNHRLQLLPRPAPQGPRR
jgi:nickel superoxide dismutase